ncbi:MAG TPA: hypothetical protein PKD86_03190 [Gemmatales bacterium]|nr:hypothetical protein [Gemmatales bacterium]HMP58338.1 hypothetical protein [Gemmatales bacterium]
MSSPHWFRLVIVLSVALLGVTLAEACPGCKDAIAAMDNANKTPFDNDPAAMGEMLSWTVLLMLGTVCGLFSTFAGTFYFMVRREAAVRSRSVVPLAAGDGAPSSTGPAEMDVPESGVPAAVTPGPA